MPVTSAFIGPGILEIAFSLSFQVLYQLKELHNVEELNKAHVRIQLDNLRKGLSTVPDA